MTIEILLSKLNKQRTNFLSISENWSIEQLVSKPSPDSWNALQVIEHVMTSEFGTLSYMKKKTLSDPKDLIDVSEVNKSASEKLNKALLSDNKWKAPQVLPKPKGNKSRKEMIVFWNELSDKIESFVLNLPNEYYSKQIFKHPFAGRLNLEQTLEFLSNHLLHHEEQLKRLDV